MSARSEVVVPFNVPPLGEEEMEAACRSIKEGAIGGGGKYTRLVEECLRDVTGASYAYFVTSCTHAMELALMALGVGPGDEVILPSFTFTSNATCVVRQKAQPVFADIDPVTWNLDPEDVARCLTPRTRVVMPVHYAGHPARLKEIAALIRPPCVLVEDAAHALGARYLGRPVGTIGEAGCFSFHITKNITCGEGGALLLRDRETARRAEFIREKGTNRAQFLRGEVRHYSWVSEGSSFAASDLLAAILVEQLKKAETILARRREIWHGYAKALAPLASRGNLTLPVLEPSVQSSYHIFAILVSPDRRDNLREALLARGIETAPHYIPLHSSPFWVQAFGTHQRPLPVTERVGRSLLRLPIYPDLTSSQQGLVIEALHELLDR